MKKERMFVRVRARQRHHGTRLYHQVSIGMQTRESLMDMYKWINEHTEGHFSVEGNKVGFEDPANATLFALGFKQ